MDGTIAPYLDPLDLEVLEKALESKPDVIKSPSDVAELESDEELECALRRELSEMVCTKGASDPDTMLEIVLGGLGKNATKV